MDNPWGILGQNLQYPNFNPAYGQNPGIPISPLGVPYFSNPFMATPVGQNSQYSPNSMFFAPGTQIPTGYQMFMGFNPQTGQFTPGSTQYGALYQYRPSNVGSGYINQNGPSPWTSPLGPAGDPFSNPALLLGLINNMALQNQQHQPAPQPVPVQTAPAQPAPPPPAQPPPPMYSTKTTEVLPPGLGALGTPSMQAMYGGGFGSNPYSFITGGF